MSKRKDTCTRKACPFWKRYREQCPNYVRGTWETPDEHEYDTHDCAPKRSMILAQQIYDFMLSTRKDYGRMRTAAVEVMKFAALQSGVDFLEGEVVDTKLIEDKTNDYGKDTD